MNHERNDQPSGERLPGPIRIGILHRNRLFSDCIFSVLATLADYEVRTIDHRSGEPEAAVQEAAVDLLLIDGHLQEELVLSLVRAALEPPLETKVLLLGSPACESTIVDCLVVGAQGCILEDSPLEELRQATQCILRGEAYCSPVLVHTMIQRLAAARPEPRWAELVRSAPLTFREREVLQLIAEHHTNKQIARKLSISIYTVKNHVHNIVEKLRVESRYEAVEYARQRRWLAPSRQR